MANFFKASTKLKRIKELQEKLRQLKTPVDRTTASKLGDTVIAEMKAMISKGISTVEGMGRFPAYLAQGRGNALRKSGASKSEVKGATKRGYPYSVQGKFPGKKDRPVNLSLSGAFLDRLISKVVSVGGNYSTEIGYYDTLSKLKEQGHREGANGQPSRPTIPTTQEGFAQRVQRILYRIYRERVKLLVRKD